MSGVYLPLVPLWLEGMPPDLAREEGGSEGMRNWPAIQGLQTGE